MPKAAPTPHWQPLVDCWFTWYTQHYGYQPTFSGPATRHLKLIATRLQQLATDRQIEWTQTTAINSLLKFLNLAHADPWLRQNLTLPVLYAKFDPIIARARQSAASQNHTGTGPKITAASLHAALSALHRHGQ